jgi:hypothetical protein
MYLRTNSDVFPILHQLIGFHNRDGVFTVRCDLGFLNKTDYYFVVNVLMSSHTNTLKRIHGHSPVMPAFCLLLDQLPHYVAHNVPYTLFAFP